MCVYISFTHTTFGRGWFVLSLCEHGVEVLPPSGAAHQLHLHQLRHALLVGHHLLHAVAVKLSGRVQVPQQLAHAADRDAERLDEQQQLCGLQVL